LDLLVSETPDFVGTIGFQTIRENLKVVFIKPTENFLAQYGLSIKSEPEEKGQGAIVLTPSVKPNYIAMAKSCGLEKQTVQISLSNIF
jgi:hypothetical protein